MMNVEESINESVCRSCGHARNDVGRSSALFNAYKSNYSRYREEGRKRKHIADTLVRFSPFFLLEELLIYFNNFSLVRFINYSEGIVAL